MSETNSVNIKDPVRNFVLEYAQGRGITEINDEESLLKNNVIDSLGVFRMIAFLEETFPLTVEDTDMVPENFQSVVAIEAFVMGKLGMPVPVAAETAQPAEAVAS